VLTLRLKVTFTGSAAVWLAVNESSDAVHDTDRLLVSTLRADTLESTVHELDRLIQRRRRRQHGELTTPTAARPTS